MGEIGGGSVECWWKWHEEKHEVVEVNWRRKNHRSGEEEEEYFIQ
jgi:hypothetical protein